MDWLKEIFTFIGDFIGEFTAAASIILLVVLFFIFDFKFLIRAYRMLRKMFRELDMPLLIAVYLPWKIKKLNIEDRRDRYKYLKSFCEFVIMHTKGEKQTKKEWVQTYQAFFLENLLSNPFQLVLDSSFDILNENVDYFIRKYFAFLNKYYKRYLHNKKQSKFTNTLLFENGFVYPLSFINGLEHKFSDSWTDLLVKYNTTLKTSKYKNTKTRRSITRAMQNEDGQHFIISQNEAPLDIENNELFMVYSWLMWSPSYQMEFPENKFKIILYGIGDESNTTNLILDNSDNSQELWEVLKETKEKNVYGVNLTIECELYEFIPYIRSHLGDFGVETLPLINNLLNNSNDTHYILSYVGPTKDASLKSLILDDDNDAFFSGYLWALYGKQDENHTKFEIKNSVAFFEHTNLADSSSVEYFTKAMAQKSVTHFKKMFDDGKTVHYNLNCAVGESFKKQYVKLVEKEMSYYNKDFQDWFKQYVNLYDNNVTINEILENIDEEFPMNEFDYKLVTEAGDIGKFYTDLYVKNFPPDERDSLDDLIHRTLEMKTDNHFDIILAYQGDELAGGVVYDWYKRSNCGLIEYIVVAPKFRGMRIAQRLVAKATAMMTNYSGKHKLNGIFAEIEDPEKMPNIDEKTLAVCNKRLRFWENNKFKKLDFNYIQPALGDGLEKLENLMLAVYSLKSDQEYIDAQVLKDFIIDFNQIANRIDNIYDEKIGIKEMLDELDAKEKGQVKIIQRPLGLSKTETKEMGK